MSLLPPMLIISDMAGAVNRDHVDFRGDCSLTACLLGPARGIDRHRLAGMLFECVRLFNPICRSGDIGMPVSATSF